MRSFFMFFLLLVLSFFGIFITDSYSQSSPKFIVYDTSEIRDEEILRCDEFQYDGDGNVYIFYTRAKNIRMTGDNYKIETTKMRYLAHKGYLYYANKETGSSGKVEPTYPNSRLYLFNGLVDFFYEYK